MSISESNAIVIERPRVASFRKIKLTSMQNNGIVCRTVMSAISSGTDMKTWMGLQPAESLYYPLVPGYENAGEVVDGNEKTAKGTKVMINECRRFGDVCAAWGGNSEFVVKDSVTAPGAFDPVAEIPANIGYKEAVLAYLPCVSLKGIKRIPLSGNEKVLVTGAGMIGISAMQILKILYPGITVIALEPHPFRREIASFYADHVLAPDGSEVAKLKEICGGKLADAVIECSGNPAMPGTLHRFIKDGGWREDDKPGHIHLQGDYPGRIVMDGYNKWFTKNCTITMTCALSPGGKEQVLQWISEGKFDTSKLPVEIWPAGKCEEAYRYKEEKGEDVFKILFDWRM